MPPFLPLRYLFNKTEVAKFSRTYSYPAKIYISSCNKAQIVYQIKVCSKVHDNILHQRQLTGLNHHTLLLRGGGKAMLFTIAEQAYQLCTIKSTELKDCS